MSYIINADDFGMSQEVNNAIIQCFKKNIIQRTTLLVNGDYTEDAVRLAKENNISSMIGLHINLIEGKPITNEIKKTNLCLPDGTFNGAYFKSIIHKFVLSTTIRKAVESECAAQMKKYIEYGFPLMHLDSHQHIHTNISVLPIVLRAAKQYGFRTIRLARNIPRRNQKGIKGIYKKVINHFIIKYNILHSDEKTRYFGSYNDYDSINSEDFIRQSESATELMCHPYMVDNHIEEHYSHKLIV